MWTRCLWTNCSYVSLPPQYTPSSKTSAVLLFLMLLMSNWLIALTVTFVTQQMTNVFYNVINPFIYFQFFFSSSLKEKLEVCQDAQTFLLQNQAFGIWKIVEISWFKLVLKLVKLQMFLQYFEDLGLWKKTVWQVPFFKKNMQWWRPYFFGKFSKETHYIIYTFPKPTHTLVKYLCSFP